MREQKEAFAALGTSDCRWIADPTALLAALLAEERSAHRSSAACFHARTGWTRGLRRDPHGYPLGLGEGSTASAPAGTGHRPWGVDPVTLSTFPAWGSGQGQRLCPPGAEPALPQD